jgi:hypothetical protein
VVFLPIHPAEGKINRWGEIKEWDKTKNVSILRIENGNKE